MLESFNQIIGLVLIIYLLDIIFVYLINKTTSIYSGIPEAVDMKQKVFQYIIYLLLALAIQKLILNGCKDVDFKSIIKSAPLLGLVIFSVYGFNTVCIVPDKCNWSMFGIDIVRGILLVTISSSLYYGINKFTSGKKK
jgi:hypothetical protein